MILPEQRFTMGYNARHGRKSRLREDRFKSVLVEGAGHVLATMAAYIVHRSQPGTRWVGEGSEGLPLEGYGEAMAGRKRSN